MKQMRYSSILTAVLWLSFVIPADASVVFSNSDNSYTGGLGIIYDSGVVVSGGAQLFTATSSFTIGSIETYFNNVGGITGCIRAHVYSQSGGLPDTSLGSSLECLNITTITSTGYGTSTFSMPDVAITSGTSYALVFLGESIVDGAYPPDFLQMPQLAYAGIGNSCSRNNGVWNCGYANSLQFIAYDTGGFDTNTHIESMLPTNGTTTSNPVTFALLAYLNEDDMETGAFGLTRLKIYLHNIDQNNLWGFDWLSEDDIVLFDDVATTSGWFLFSTTTTLTEGNYRLHAELNQGIWTTLDEEDSQFIVGSSTFIGFISQNSWSAIHEVYASTSATSTVELAKTCVPWSGSFDTIYCMTFLFVPDPQLIGDTFSELRSSVLTRFPLGYATDFFTIMATTSTSTMLWFNFDTPAGFGFAPVHFSFDAYRSLDWILYATTTEDFNTVGAVSEQTFYEITNGYWTYFVYFALILYFLRRLFGYSVIPESMPELRDLKKKDDLYASNATMKRARKSKENYGDPYTKIQ